MKYWNLVSSLVTPSCTRQEEGQWGVQRWQPATVVAGFNIKQLWKQTRPWALESSRDGEEFQYTLDRLVKIHWVRTVPACLTLFSASSSGSSTVGWVLCSVQSLATMPTSPQRNRALIATAPWVWVCSLHQHPRLEIWWYPSEKRRARGKGGGRGILKQQ